MKKLLTVSLVSLLFVPMFSFAAVSAIPVPPSTPTVPVPTTPVPPVPPPPTQPTYNGDGGGALQFVAQAWDSKILTWQYKTVPCAYFNGCVDITKTAYWAKLKAQFPNWYK